MSAFHLSFRSLSADQQEAIKTLIELFDTFNDCSERYHEIEVTRLKLGFWQEELNLCFQGQPRHPFTQKLLPLCAKYQLPEAKFQGLLQGAILRLETSTYDTQIDLEQHYAHTGGLLASLIAQICVFPRTYSATEEYEIIQAGVAWEIIRHIADFSMHLAHGHCPIPLRELDTFELDPASLTEIKSQEKLSRLLLIQGTRSRLLAEPLLKTRDKALQSLRRYTRIQIALLDQIERDHFQVLRHKWHLGYLKKRWISWRTR